MIRNTVILGLLALGALAVAAPALTGFYIAREFDDTIAGFERSGLAHVVSSRFSRGWFNSRAAVRVRLDDAYCLHTPCQVVTLDSTIHHGPIAFTAPADPAAGLASGIGVAVTRIDPAALWPRLLFEPKLAPLRLVTRIGFDGRTVTRLRADGARIDISRERALAHVDMSALTARAEVAPGGAVAGALDWPRFKLVGAAGGQLGWRGLTATTGELDASEGGVTGPQLQVESLRLANHRGLAVLLQGLVGRVQPLPSQADRASARFDIHASRVVLDDQEYGPLIVQGRAANLDPDARARLRAQRAASDGDESDVPLPATFYRDTVPRLLAGEPVIDIERLLLHTPAGAVHARLRIAAPESPRPARLLADVISQLAVDFELEMPAVLVGDIARQVIRAKGRAPSDIKAADVDRALADVVAQGLIDTTAPANAYRLRLVIEDGRLALNGRNQPGWQSVVDRFETARERL